MIVLTFDDMCACAKVPVSLVRKLRSVGWRQTGVADQNNLGEIVFDGDETREQEAKDALNQWISTLSRPASLDVSDESVSETSSLDKPDVKTDDVVDNKVKLKRQIGRGQFATVWSGDRLEDSGACAIKLFTTDEDYAEIIQREVKAMKDIGEHANIVAMLAHGHDEQLNCGYIVFERMTCDLFAALRQRGAMPISTALRTFASVLHGIDHVHSKGIAHGDIKPENVLTDPQGRICIGDFGGSMRANEKGVCTDSDESCHVTTEYRAPEVILDDRFELKSDIWSAAALLYEICTTEPLFTVDDESDDDGDDDDDDEEEEEQTKDAAETKDIAETNAETKGTAETKDFCGAKDPAEAKNGAEAKYLAEAMDAEAMDAEAMDAEATDAEATDAEAETQQKSSSPSTALIQVDVPLQVDENIIMEEDDSDDDSDFDLNDALDELTEHQKQISQLACMVRVLGPVPKYIAKKHSDIFSVGGYVQGFTGDRGESLEELLKQSDVKPRDIPILATLLQKLLKYQISKRPTAREVLNLRAMKEFC